MDIRIGFKMTFVTPGPTPILLLLYVHPEEAGDLHHPQRLEISTQSGREIPLEHYTDSFGNPAARITAPEGQLTLSYDNVITRPDYVEPVFANARQHMVEELPLDTLPYLLPSRYCESDRLGDKAWELFGNVQPGWPRVQAINDWVHNHIEFGYHHARPTMSAYDVFESGKGVCRDYMHLAIAFCRCLNIPARYATGYLGDIRVPVIPGPMDFSAYYEVYLDGRWHPFDARHNQRRFGRTLMARGRDAADTALTTSFNPMYIEEFSVWTDEVG
jgi:transglutaminase-like putative cysteine protease